MEAAIVSKNRGEGSISFFIYNLFTAKKYFINNFPFDFLRGEALKIGITSSALLIFAIMLRPGNLQRNILGAGRKG